MRVSCYEYIVTIITNYSILQLKHWEKMLSLVSNFRIVFDSTNMSITQMAVSEQYKSCMCSFVYYPFYKHPAAWNGVYCYVCNLPPNKCSMFVKSFEEDVSPNVCMWQVVKCVWWYFILYVLWNTGWIITHVLAIWNHLHYNPLPPFFCSMQ